MKKFTFALIILAIATGNLALEAAIANTPHNDSDLIAYAASVPKFKASVWIWINPGCSASRVQLREDDPYDFYITAAHCLDKSPFLSNDESLQLYKELLKDGVFETENINCDDSDNSIQGKHYPSLENIGCGFVLKLNALARTAINMGLIESCPSSEQDFLDILKAHAINNTQLGDDDMIALEKLKCIIHSSYQEEDEDRPVGIDLALCTPYEKNYDLAKYELKFLRDMEEIQGKKLISVSFGSRNTTDLITNLVPDRQAFDTLVTAWDTELEAIKDQEVSISENPTGHCAGGDSGGSLLFKELDDSYSLVAVTTGAGGSTLWTILDPQFIAEAYEQLIKDGPGEIEKADL